MLTVFEFLEILCDQGQENRAVLNKKESTMVEQKINFTCTKADS